MNVFIGLGMFQIVVTLILAIVVFGKDLDNYWLEFLTVGGVSTAIGITWKLIANFWDGFTSYQMAFFGLGMINLALAAIVYMYAGGKFSETLRSKVVARSTN